MRPRQAERHDLFECSLHRRGREQRQRVDAKLGNEKFVANAPEEIVEEEKEKREAAVERKAKLQEALERLKLAS